MLDITNSELTSAEEVQLLPGRPYRLALIRQAVGRIIEAYCQDTRIPMTSIVPPPAASQDSRKGQGGSRMSGTASTAFEGPWRTDALCEACLMWDKRRVEYGVLANGDFHTNARRPLPAWMVKTLQERLASASEQSSDLAVGTSAARTSTLERVIAKHEAEWRKFERPSRLLDSAYEASERASDSRASSSYVVGSDVAGSETRKPRKKPQRSEENEESVEVLDRGRAGMKVEDTTPESSISAAGFATPGLPQRADAASVGGSVNSWGGGLRDDGSVGWTESSPQWKGVQERLSREASLDGSDVSHGKIRVSLTGNIGESLREGVGDAAVLEPYLAEFERSEAAASSVVQGGALFSFGVKE
ncbi:hypothetical protein FOZ63_011147 [Perkinsus olseni]|uniref:Uncharacterized protein n=1 Tax=Perkinsus olseni TaxID=32597 RepID=A0A7J6QSK3_PEROL|nr:hypothetical protein FOZ63_011147 [Perkinsus olseni]KAF4711263.1 hypothetical protein FOZ62_013094 [Perkinsus olseni]